MEKDSLDASLPLGEYTYNKYCVVCHQKDRKGNVASGYPSLVNLRSTHKKNAVALTIEMGKGMMTDFHRLKKRKWTLCCNSCMEKK